MLDTTRRFVHCDINSYFATMLQEKYPHLRNKPVGVVKEKGRTCIIAASKEAKVKGVKTGSRLKEALALCPDLIVAPSEFDYYLRSTKKLHQLFQSLVPKVEIYSLDEAFLDLSDCNRYYPNAQAFGQILQEQVKKILGSVVTCNVGISYTRFLAKLAGENSPKESVFEITLDNLDEVLANATFEDVCGVGYRLGGRLEALGITNLYQLNFYSDEFLYEHFGPYWTVQLRKMSRGEEPDHLSRIDKNSHMKSVGRSITGWDLCDSEQTIKRVLYNLVEEVCHKARKMGLAGRYVSVYLRGQEESWGKHITLSYYTNQAKEMFDLIYQQLYSPWHRSFKIIKFGVMLSMLKPVEEIPERWFPQWHKWQRIYQAVDKVSEKYGLYTVHPASITKEKLIKPEVTGFLGDKIYQFEYT